MTLACMYEWLVCTDRTFLCGGTTVTDESQEKGNESLLTDLWTIARKALYRNIPL